MNAMATTTRSTKTKAPDFSGRLKAVPTKPGVYLMRNAQGEVIYVGKAASLRNRLRSYFQTPFGKEPKVQVMVSRIADFEYIVAESESEALLLENLLIKQHKPFYNARLKDDKTYPYIKIDLSEEFPQLYFTRRVLPDGARYFGPFASAGSVRTTMDLLKKLFPYRSCTKVITGTDERPCLEYYINRCVGPCIGAVDQAEYQEVVHQVIQFLEGDLDDVLKSLEAKMAAASEQTQFERAAVLRDQVRAIQSVSEAQKVVSARGDDEDVIALAHDQGEAWVELFKVRRGKLIGRDHFLMEGGEVEEPPRMLEEFIQQFYDATPDVPPSLMVQYEVENQALLEGWLTAKRGGKVTLRVPQRGEKRRLMAMVAENAAQGLTQRRIKWLNESDQGAPRAHGAPGGTEPAGAARPHRVLRHLQHPGDQLGGQHGGLRAGPAEDVAVPALPDQERRGRGRLRVDAGIAQAPLQAAGRGAQGARHTAACANRRHHAVTHDGAQRW